MDMGMDRCVRMRRQAYQHVYGSVETRLCRDMCIDVCIDMCIGICMDVNIDICIDMCTGMCVDLHVGRHVHGPVYGPVERLPVRAVSYRSSAKTNITNMP